MVNATGFSYVTDAFYGLNVFGIKELLAIAVIFLTMLLITRNYEKWKVLSLPTTIAWQVAGLRAHVFWYVGSAILFVVSALSMEVIGNIFSSVSAGFEKLMERKRAVAERESVMKDSLKLQRDKIKELREYKQQSTISDLALKSEERQAWEKSQQRMADIKAERNIMSQEEFIRKQEESKKRQQEMINKSIEEARGRQQRKQKDIDARKKAQAKAFRKAQALRIKKEHELLNRKEKMYSGLYKE